MIPWQNVHAGWQRASYLSREGLILCDLQDLVIEPLGDRCFVAGFTPELTPLKQYWPYPHSTDPPTPMLTPSTQYWLCPYSTDLSIPEMAPPTQYLPDHITLTTLIHYWPLTPMLTPPIQYRLCLCPYQNWPHPLSTYLPTQQWPHSHIILLTHQYQCWPQPHSTDSPIHWPTPTTLTPHLYSSGYKMQSEGWDEGQAMAY
jgi:hypothetical protein